MEQEPEIIFENDDFVVINKPSGWQVHPAKIAANKIKRSSHDSNPMLTDWLMKRYPEVKHVGDDPVTRPGIVHRLDKETSGVMIIPRNQATFERLKALFQKHAMQKTYVALVSGTLQKKEGVIDAPIGIKNGTLKRSIHAVKMVKPAVTAYKVIKKMEEEVGSGFSLLQVKPETGRTHQIRVHLASIGHPIVGDALYGSKKQPAWASRLMLHAKALEFSDGGNSFSFEAPIPEGFKRIIHKSP